MRRRRGWDGTAVEDGAEVKTAANSTTAVERVEQAEPEIWVIIQVLKGVAATVEDRRCIPTHPNHKILI